ncbi:MAG: tripartite tricarboxylate transporter substrate binding protein [Burkholderiales bacterium]|nr:tripartite tricarboxylate transporter substrate binding protein [Burkholderiales bacterium]
MAFARPLASLAAALFAAALPAVVAAQAPLKLIVGFPPGATSDTMTRALAEGMRAGFDRPIVVENRPGGGGLAAAKLVKAAPPDGTTLLMTPFGTMLQPHSVKAADFNPLTDFTPITQISTFDIAFALGPNVPASTLRDYVALVKKEPRRGDFASAAAGSLPHFFTLMFAKYAGIEMTHIPYKGTAPAVTATIGGEVNLLSTTSADISNQVKAGKLRAIAVSSARRSPVLPDVPTLREQGYNIEGGAWYAMVGPPGMAPDLVRRLNAAIVAAIKAPATAERMRNMGVEPTGTTPEAFAALFKADYERWGAVIKASGFKADD